MAFFLQFSLPYHVISKSVKINLIAKWSTASDSICGATVSCDFYGALDLFQGLFLLYLYLSCLCICGKSVNCDFSGFGKIDFMCSNIDGYEYFLAEAVVLL